MIGVEQLGGERVEVERAVAVRAAGRVGAAVGAHRFHAVDAHARELRTEAAHADLPAFAGIARDRHAGHALDGFGQIQVGEVGDVFGDDRVDRADRVALVVERDAQALAEAGDDDLFDLACSAAAASCADADSATADTDARPRWPGPRAERTASAIYQHVFYSPIVATAFGCPDLPVQRSIARPV